MTKKKMYNDYVKQLSDHFEAQFSNISVGYNFDYGDEFEIAICKILSVVLPNKYAVCRGYVVAADGTFEGDDIIIYDRFHLPVLRPLDDQEFALKQKIPIESVYAYIEAKNGLVIKGTIEDGGSIAKSINQIHKVKKLINNREKVSLRTINRYVHLPNTPKAPTGYPDFRNPSYAILCARSVKIKKNDSPTENPTEILEALKEHAGDLDINSSTAPDLMVFGKSCLSLPINEINGREICRSPFYGFGGSDYKVHESVDRAFGISLIFLMAALEYIEVGRMNFGEIVIDALTSD